MKPDFSNRIDLRGIGSTDVVGDLIRDECLRIREQGATWLRATMLNAGSDIVIEGWRERPEDEGPQPE